MLNVIEAVRKNIDTIVKLLPILSFIIPFLGLYFLDPKSFEMTWKGRTFYIFFLWLVSLEAILNWEKLQVNKISKLRAVRTIAFIIALTLPTIYVAVANYWILNNILLDLARNNNIVWIYWVPLFTEYLVFTAFYVLIILIEYGISGLKDFSISAVFLGLIGLIYTIDTLYPYGRFAPFQIFVPITATLAASVLNMLGFETTDFFVHSDPIQGSLTYLNVKNFQGKSAAFDIAWPCSGIESLLIYSVTILLFLKSSAISWKHRIIYFIIGAVVTYFINILRIVTIFVIAANGGDIGPFHTLYGQLYSITWIIAYPLIIIGSRVLWGKIRNWNTARRQLVTAN